MALIIRPSFFFPRRYLVVTEWGIVFTDTRSSPSQRKFRFSEIDCMLMSAGHVLSVQVGREVFSVATRPAKRKHGKAIARLKQQLSASQKQEVVAEAMTGWT